MRARLSRILRKPNPARGASRAWVAPVAAGLLCPHFRPMNAYGGVIMSVQMFKRRVSGWDLRGDHSQRLVGKFHMMPGFLFERDLGRNQSTQHRACPIIRYSHSERIVSRGTIQNLPIGVVRNRLPRMVKTLDSERKGFLG